MENTPFVGFIHSSAIVLTNVCRQACGYCAFRENEGALLPLKKIQDQLIAIRSGKATEVVFFAGESPQEYPQIQMALAREECASFNDYLARACQMALQLELLPVLSVGHLEALEARKLVDLACSARVTVVCDDLTKPGEAHEKARGRTPIAGRESIEYAHSAGLPYHLEILVGIGESAEARLNHIRELARFCAVDPLLQDVRLVPFQPNPGTSMHDRPPLPFEEMAAAMRVLKAVFPVHQISVPVNLFSRFDELIPHGLNDLGSFQFANPDPVMQPFPFPTFDALQKRFLSSRFALQERLPLTTPAGFKRASFAGALESCRVRMANRSASTLDLIDNHQCFVCGTDNPTGLKLTFQLPAPYSCSTTWAPTPAFQGYAGMTHGGILSTLLDEVMAQCLIRWGIRVVTADMTIRFLRPAPLHAPMNIFANRTGGRRHIHFTRGGITTTDGAVIAEAEGRYAEC